MKKIRIVLVALLVVLPLLAMLSACGECTHANLTDEKVITPATCTADGKGTHVCADCQEVIEFVIPATGHTEVVDAGVDYTCTADGLSEGKHCSTCSAVLVAQQVLPAAHRPTEWIVTKAASCEIDGYRVKNCTACEERVASEAITKIGHLESDWEITKAAACEATGTKRTTCLNCQEVMQTATIPATGHDESSWQITKAATCEATGSKHTICNTCKVEMNTASIPATGHSESGWEITLNATCEASGSKHTICNTCKVEMNTASIDPLGHNMAWNTTLEPTCTATGLKQYKCTRCSEITEEQAINAKGHLYTSNVVDPTCVLDGYTKHSCTRCTYFYSDNTVPKTGHSYTSVVTNPTCTVAGYTTHTCNTCGNTVKDTPTQPLGHSYSEVIEPATCKASGQKYNQCFVCQYKDTASVVTIPATGHSLSTNTYTTDMGSGTERKETIIECVHGDYYYVRKVEFYYSNSTEHRLGANEGYSYGMSVDHDDLLAKNTEKQELATNFTVNTTFVTQHDTFPTTAVAHLCITAKGHIDKALGFVGGLDDKTEAFNNSLGYYDGENGSGTYKCKGDFKSSNLKDKHVYFVFTNQNQFAAYRVKSVSATAVFDYGEPASN